MGMEIKGRKVNKVGEYIFLSILLGLNIGKDHKLHQGFILYLNFIIIYK